MLPTICQTKNSRVKSKNVKSKPKEVHDLNLDTKSTTCSLNGGQLSCGRRACIDLTDNFTKLISSRCLDWEQSPESILIIRKLDAETVRPFMELALWLLQTKKMTVHVEEKTFSDADFSNVKETFTPLRSSLRVFHGYERLQELREIIDIIICLGGDGTVLYALSLFKKSIPPVMSFNFGSLGFLSPF